MNNEALNLILHVPLFWRSATVMFILWFVYMLASRGIFKLFALVPALINWFWFFLYRAANNLTHALHKAGGKAMIGIDQAVTDFFGDIYGFFCKVGMAINNVCMKKIPVMDEGGRQRHDQNGMPMEEYIPKRPYVGAVFLIAMILVLWIAAPTWLDVETNTNIFTAPYHKYVEIEGSVLDMIFASSNN